MKRREEMREVDRILGKSQGYVLVSEPYSGRLIHDRYLGKFERVS